MGQNLASAGIYLIQTFIGLYVLMIMIRFLMQISRVDYYNPICQGIVKITDPAIRPFRTVLPTIRGVNFASLTAAFIVQLIGIVMIMLLSGNPLIHPVYFAWVAIGLFSMIFNIYFFALIIMVISSWIAPYSSHPALVLIHQITDPICTPARKLLPPMGGLDLSIILVFAALHIIDDILVIKPIAISLRIPAGLILGLP
ncbi:YggT family protein [Pseudomonadales bacterium]|nr:YggT family protein [Pseudomonadales bacterium]